MKKAKRFLAIVLSMIMLMSLLTACGESKDSDGKGSDEKISITVGVMEDFGDLGPFSTVTGFEIHYTQAVFDTFCTIEEYGGEVTWNLAKNIEQISDTEYDIEMYDYITDSAGNNITADDVIFSFEFARDCGRIIKMANIKSIEKLDTYKVRMTLANNYLGTFENAVNNWKIVSKKAFEESGDEMATADTLVGTGPYVIKEYVEGSSLTLVKRDDYWQKDESLIAPSKKPYADEIKYVYISDTSQLAVALETGEIDAIAHLSDSNVDYFINEDGTAKDGYTVDAVLNSLMYSLCFNMKDGSVFADNKELREAIMYAIDSPGILKSCLDGKGEVAYCYGSSCYADFQEEWKDEDYYWQDVEKAEELLEDSGFDTGRELRLLVQTSSPWKEMGELIQSYLSAIGIKVTLVTPDSVDYAVQLKDKEAWDMAVVLSKSPDIFPNLWAWGYDYANKGEDTLNFYQSDELQEKLTTVRTAEGHTEENINELKVFFTEEVGVYGLVNAYIYSIAKDDVISGFKWNGNPSALIWACDLAE